MYRGKRIGRYAEGGGMKASRFRPGQYFRGGVDQYCYKIIEVKNGNIYYKKDTKEVFERTLEEGSKAFNYTDASTKWHFVSKLEGMMYVGE